MNYEETIELEENIKLKNEANEIYNSFLRNIKLEPKNYKGDGRFLYWRDDHNATYIRLKDDVFTLECRFLHETYNVNIKPESIFNGLKQKYRGIEHLKSYVRDNRGN